MDFMFVGAEGTFVDEPRAKATVLMVICKDDGNMSATEMRAKTDGSAVHKGTGGKGAWSGGKAPSWSAWKYHARRNQFERFRGFFGIN